VTPAWLALPRATPDTAAGERAATRQAQLTKPPGSLGRLETLAVRLAALQGADRPAVERVHVCVFAGDHGVAAQGVSAFPQAVTAQMLGNFVAGGAAVSVLARAQGAVLEVVNLGTAVDPGPLANVIDARIAPMTADFTTGPAMTDAQLAAALDAGRAAVQRAVQADAQLFIGGEMGIANTTAAAALTCALLGEPPAALSGPGTGLDAAGVARKAAVIERALALHEPHMDGPLDTLRRLGGFEIAALTGAAIACAQAGLPLLVDGFIVTAAVLAACRVQPAVRDWLLFAHRSAEPGHGRLLQALDADPLLALDLRLGEGSGALTALPLLRLACALHNGMATFDQAGVAGSTA
jgi:nicotinate-nucleotide--dimethylbenzimidazole phosphoribosyltransferase